jgi:iron complex outermembrane recepter protein
MPGINAVQDERVLDLSASYQLSSGPQLRSADEPLRMYRDNESNRIGRYHEYGRSYLLDVTKFRGL